MSNPWKPRFVPTHRKKRDPLKAAQIAPVQRIQPVLCVTCEHPRLIHGAEKCLRVGCECTEYVEEAE